MGKVLQKEAFGLAAKDNSGVLSPFSFTRRFHNCFYNLYRFRLNELNLSFGGINV